MDDDQSDQYSRAPEIEDLKALCSSLNEHGVEYLLIGGFAVILHGYVRATKSIELLVTSTPENIRRIKKALAYLPDNAIALIDDRDVETYTVVRIGDEIVVDLLAKACGVDYSEAKDHREWITVEGVQIPVANKQILIRMKDTVRPSDQSDRQFLERSLRMESENR